MPPINNSGEQGKSPSDLNNTTPGKGQEIALSVGQQAQIRKDLGMTLVAVADDSRCPVGVDCVWSGELVVEIKLDDYNGDTNTTFLSTLGPPALNPEKYNVNKSDYRAFAYLFNGYAIQIEKASPQRTPADKNPTLDQSRYQITFSVLGLGK